ncbi:GNAT family N-acetyltransferase [Microbacterium paludicola]|uniref:GNAT family N-acetyltransferase n=1 Tax=Microbacterium paludicola TaxID=300019 RepID=UPI0028D15783|nr:GNAT family N-acetyltransferase [Microbacterium paludicola]
MSARLLPSPTARLRFREMDVDDLDDVAALWGDPEVMTYYPSTRTREEAGEWIARMQDRYERDGHGLWIIETHDGRFVGDCGITWQSYNDTPVREVGYHVVRSLQGRGYATEAAAACVELVRSTWAPTLLTAIIHPDNTASRRVAEHLGMSHIADDHAHPWIVRRVMGMTVEERPQTAS